VVKVGPNAVGPPKTSEIVLGPQCYQFFKEHCTVVCYAKEVEPHQYRPYSSSSTTTSSYEAQLTVQTTSNFYDDLLKPSKLGQTDLVFGLRSDAIGWPVHAGFPISTCE